METNCVNCETELRPEFEYCPKCSQKAHLHRLSWHEILHEAVHYFTHADKGFLHLLRDLPLKGGFIAKQYITGKRKKYFSPLNFFLIVAALNLFAINIDEPSQRPDTAREHAAELAAIGNPQQRAAMLKVYQRQVEAIDFIKHHSNKTVLVMLPIIAFVFWLYYRRRHYNYTEHLVAGMYMYGFCTLVFVGMALLNLLLKTDINAIYGLALLVQLVYFTRFYYQLMDNSGGIRAFIASLTAICCVFVFTGVAVMLYVIGGL